MILKQYFMVYVRDAKMKNKKAIIIILLAVILVLTSCTKTANVNDDRLQVVCTIFPQYDFVRQIAGENVEVTMLLSAGAESHSYEPTPLDIKRINDADLFIYTGKYMEPWAQSIVDSIDSRRTVVLDASQNIKLIDIDSSHDNDVEHTDDHDTIHQHDNDEHHEKDHDEHADENMHQHQHGADPHIWLDPNLAEIMVDNITDALCEKDPNHSNYYKEQSSIYKNKLEKLDNDFQEMIDNAQKDTIAIAGHFAYAYFFNRYDIGYITAYDSSSSHDEPSVKRLIEVVDFMNEQEITTIYHEQLVDPKVAKSVASQTGSELAVLHTVHNLSEQRMKLGTTYLDVMYENLEALRKGLN